MTNETDIEGSIKEFDHNWKNREESLYNHWVKGKPKNQIQLAFRNHWSLFQEFIADKDYCTCLEVGCGRGSISSYFSDSGYDCTLLDSSEHVLDIAKEIFDMNGHSAVFVHGNALDLPFNDNSFDIVVSIGLLEHFEDIERPISEQHRVLKPGGTFLGYIVPDRVNRTQRCFNWLNKALSLISRSISKGKTDHVAKDDIFRSAYGSEQYVNFISKLDINGMVVTGAYPLPMISHSPEFPFSLLPKPMEFILTRVFEVVLKIREIVLKKHPWMCKEESGQAFLVVFRKVE